MTVMTFAADKVDLRPNARLLSQMQAMRSSELSNAEMLLQSLGTVDMTLQLVRTSGTRSITHSRYTMLYKGVPVWGENIILTEDGSQRVLMMHGNAITGIERDILSVTPAFDSATAFAIARELHHTKMDVRAFEVMYNESSNLVVYLDGDVAKLCYAVSFFGDIQEGGKPTRPTYIIDANNKSVVFYFDGLAFEDGTGPGGNEKTGKYHYGTDYPAFKVSWDGSKSTMLTSNVKTVNLNHSYSGSTAYSYTGTENTVKTINGAYSPLNDAHFFGAVVFAMYKDWYNASPLTSGLLTLRVHYSNSYENAFWDGSAMTFGDGKSRFYPLVSLDVVNHEVSHGYTEQHSGLVYSGQSGGINESFSDMAGEAAEYYMQGKNDFMVGADIFKSTGALRYMYDPPKDGKSIGSAKNYTSGMDVHYSSGVFNKAFYILAVKPGWNTKMAFDVFVKAQDIWPSGATFVQGAQGAKDAAGMLNYSTADVVNAFAGVDVAITD